MFALLAVQSSPGCTETLLPSLDNQERSQQIALQPTQGRAVCVCVSVSACLCLCVCVRENTFPFAVSNVAGLGVGWGQGFKASL